MKAVLTFVLFSFFSQFLFSQEILLRFQPGKGENFVYSLLSEGTMTQSVMGMEQVVNSKTEVRYSYFIQNVSKDGEVEILISVDTIKTNVKSQNPPLDTTFVIPSGFKFKQVLNKFGKGISFEILEMKELPLPGGADRRIDRRSYLHNIVFPEGKIKPGDSWDFSSIDTTSGREGTTVVKTKGKYTYDGVETVNQIKCARLKLDANFSISGQGTIQGMNYGLEGEGKIVGAHWVDLETGLVVRSDTNTEIEMAIGITGQYEMTMPMSQKMKTVVNLIR